MRLDQATWREVEAYLEGPAGIVAPTGIIVPTGSTEQHGPMGLIGTDAFCAEKIAEGAGQRAGAMVAPTIAYAPAPFNTSFPGTISISGPLFEALVREIAEGLIAQGFRHIYFLNGHGANLEPLRRVAARFGSKTVRVRSWWDFAPVNRLRTEYYGDWEGMHATPSEISITQETHRIVPPGIAQTPPERLSLEYIREHAGDRHGPPEMHRKQFPDGRVGSHSALARPEHGKALLAAAIEATANDYLGMLGGDMTNPLE